MKIAIVGTGIAGNVVAHTLCRQHDITVYEANDYVGGHTNTIDVTTADGDLSLDTGFIVFNDQTYPAFLSLLDSLGVESQASAMSFSVQCVRSKLEYNGSSLSTLFAQRRNLFRRSFYRMLLDILRFNEEALQLLEDDNLDLSLAEFLRKGSYCHEFVEQYLIPMGAAIWSAEPCMMEKMPVHFFVRFFHNHGLLNIKDRPEWRVIKGGSRQYVRKLIAGHRDRIRTNCLVHSIERFPTHVKIRARGVEAETFDYVFIACHSDQALRLLVDPSQAEHEVLSTIPYKYNQAVLHTDQSLMPVRKRAWGAWNYHIPEHQSQGVAVTYHLNRLQGLNTREQYFVTLNSEDRIRPESVIKCVDYEHPVFTAAGVRSQKRHSEINGTDRTYYCGAYWRNGFHEDGVVSAQTALRDLETRVRYEERYLQRAS